MRENYTRNRTRKPEHKKSSATRDSIYRAAIEIMQKEGFGGATIREICKKAGVSIGTFYNYFNTKNDILKDVYLTGDAYFSEVVVKELEGKDTISKFRLFALHYGYINLITGIDLMKVLYNPENKWFTYRRDMQLILYEIALEGIQTNTLRGDLSASFIVDVVFTSMRGVCLSWCNCSGSFQLEKRLVAQIDALLFGMCASESALPPIDYQVIGFN